METEIIFLSEDMMESEHANASFSFTGSAPKGDDDEEDDEDTDETDDATGDDPPLDDNVVHSPVTTQPGGKPKS